MDNQEEIDAAFTAICLQERAATRQRLAYAIACTIITLAGLLMLYIIFAVTVLLTRAVF